jgi:hypothetical protein
MLPKITILPFKYLFYTLTSIIIFGYAASPIFAQSGQLLNLTDYVNVYGTLQVAEHTISFTIPPSASPLRTTDYIQIYLPSFGGVTPPTALDGPYGAGPPNFTVSGTYARITGITAVPGSTLVVRGITAGNPMNESYYQISVMITEDENGAIVKNIASTFAQQNFGLRGSINVTASIDTPQARLIIDGDTAPSSFITFTEAGSVIGTDVSGLNGEFRHIFSGLQPGNHQMLFYGSDPNRLTTTPIIINIYLPAFQETSITNQILSPTLKLYKTGFFVGEPIIATGSALPNGNITLFTEAPLRTYSTMANENGDWTYTITNTDQYVLGDYHIHALAQNGIGTTSLNSPSVGFSLLPSEGGVIGSSCGDISQGDLNCDTLVDLTDFSILMYYWGTNNATADINEDLIVNLTDFSMMMYWWGT